MPATLSLDLRERILKAYDKGEGTRAEIAWRYNVSVGMVKKLLQQRRHTGDIAPLHHRAGRKPLLLPAHERQLRDLLAQKNDLTLRELRSALGIDCSLQAIHAVLARIGLTLKKRRSGPANKIVRILPKPGARGGAGKLGSIRTGSSSSTNRGPKPT